jgi:uncharacterized protein YkwD
VPLHRSSSVFLLTILSCTALIAGSASSIAAASQAASPRATTAARAHVSCARRSTRAARRACRAARSQRVRETTRSHATKSRPAKKARTKATTPRVAATPESGSAETTIATPQHDAATIAAVLAAPCQNTELTPEAANIGLVREAVLCLINRKRAENNESPLVISADLQAAAESHDEELIADDYFAHVSPSGETPVDRIRRTGYIPGPNVGYVIGENLAWGTYQLSTPQAIVSAWIASPGHLANILESQYRETGIAITPAVPETVAPGAPGATYAQEFGVIIS